MNIDERLSLAAEEYLASTDLAYDECAKGVYTLDRIIVGTPSKLAAEARGYLVPALYAYWERFFRISFGEYLRCTALAKIPAEHLKSGLAVFRVGGEIAEIASRHKLKHFHELCNNRTIQVVKGLLSHLIATIEQPADFAQPHTWIKTHSNVGFTTLEENCTKVGIDINALKANFASKSLFASLKDLVDMRNDIAHGSQFKSLTADEWEEAKDFVLKIMQVVQFEIYDALQDRNKMLDPQFAESDFQI